MAQFRFITVRLGKDSLPEIKKICASEVGIIGGSLTISVRCTQVPDSYRSGDYAFIWLGSDNRKGLPTSWKQGFKAVGRINSVTRGVSYNDTSETTIDIVYIFREAITRVDILRCAPTEYYWCSSFPLIGLDDSANQTIRNMSGTSFADIRAFFCAIELVTKQFKKDIIEVEPSFKEYFNIILPNPAANPLLKNIDDLPLKYKMDNNLQFQQIFYGAPGTGKSHKIKTDERVKFAASKNLVFRTTFHPDSDYSTFVGTYKPATDESPIRRRMNLSLDDLAQELSSDYTNEELGKIAGLQKFCFDYYPYISGEYMNVNVSQLLEKAKVPKDYNVEINKYVKFCRQLPKHDTSKITYKFTPQSFTNAYVAAWNNPEENVFLIIEEINRGNCAQIFGDLFQLLDRDDEGYSEYPITADTDLLKYLNGKDENEKDILTNKDGIKDGKLRLPSNLYIWATMNTSDQSLFPIDSAFKRRWEWKYIKIQKGKDENGQELNWMIDVKLKGANGQEEFVSWWDFIKKINDIIASMTSSADKQLGYFFCKAKDGIIDKQTFVSKVIFYLWNDVFKDYGFEDNSLFRYIDDKGVEQDLTFPDFFKDEVDEVNDVRLTDFVQKVMSWKKKSDNKD